jgi:hypothetical protein
MPFSKALETHPQTYILRICFGYLVFVFLIFSIFFYFNDSFIEKSQDLLEEAIENLVESDGYSEECMCEMQD